jgi:hypothetical protein
VEEVEEGEEEQEEEEEEEQDQIHSTYMHYYHYPLTDDVTAPVESTAVTHVSIRMSVELAWQSIVAFGPSIICVPSKEASAPSCTANPASRTIVVLGCVIDSTLNTSSVAPVDVAPAEPSSVSLVLVLVLLSVGAASKHDGTTLSAPALTSILVDRVVIAVSGSPAALSLSLLHCVRSRSEHAPATPPLAKSARPITSTLSLFTTRSPAQLVKLWPVQAGSDALNVMH